jgi:hypothetical protein
VSVRIYILYDLLPEVSVAEYLSWSKAVDQPACRAMPICESIRVTAVSRREGPGDGYQIIEDVVVESAQAWALATASPTHAPIASQWERYGDSKTVVTLICNDATG